MIISDAVVSVAEFCVSCIFLAWLLIHKFLLVLYGGMPATAVRDKGFQPAIAFNNFDGLWFLLFAGFYLLLLLYQTFI